MNKTIAKTLILTVTIVLCLLLMGQMVFAEASTAPSASDITIENNPEGSLDSITIDKVISGDIVYVYSVATKGIPIASALASSTTVQIRINQIGKTAGKLYISMISSGKTESARTEKAYSEESSISAILAEAVMISNYPVGELDEITVDSSSLTIGDVIRVYTIASGGSPIVSNVVSSETTKMYLYQLGISAGSAYLAVTRGNSTSARTKVSYLAEPISASPSTTNITVTNNNYGTSDTVAVTGLTVGDVVNVYTAATSGTLLGTATVESEETSATVTIVQLGTKNGAVYIEVATPHKRLSVRTKAYYPAEGVSNSPITDNITVTNSVYGIYDTVVVDRLNVYDIVKVYGVSSGGAALGTATVEDDETSATITIDQLGTKAGTVYVTVTSTGKTESIRTSKTYTSEVTAAPLAANIIVANNFYETSDAIKVIKLTEGDIVTVYQASTGGAVLGTATVEDGATTATITVSQLGTAAGKVYVSITTTGKSESVRTAKAYSKEAGS